LNDLGWKLFNALFPRTLESFSRRFADYGEQETELAKKVAQVRAQLQEGQAGIFFYPDDESFEILPKEQFPLAG
jgi:uncharacterized protein YheU (UPF0270 family)